MVTKDQRAALLPSDRQAGGVPEFGEGEKMGAMMPVSACQVGQEKGPEFLGAVDGSRSRSSSSLS